MVWTSCTREPRSSFRWIIRTQDRRLITWGLSQRVADEPFAYIHPQTDRDLVTDGRDSAGGNFRLQGIAGFRFAGSRLSDNPGPHILSWGKSGRDGVRSDRSAGTPDRRSPGPEPDDLEQI